MNSTDLKIFIDQNIRLALDGNLTTQKLQKDIDKCAEHSDYAKMLIVTVLEREIESLKSKVVALENFTKDLK